MRKLTFQSFALGSGEMPRIGDGDMGDSTYLGSAGRGRPFGWETRGAWDTGAPSFWAVSLPTLSVSAAFPSGRSLSLSTPHHGGSVATQAEGGFRSRSLWSGLSFLPPAKGTSLGLSPEPRIPPHLAPACSSPWCPGRRSLRFGSSASHYAWWLARLYSAGLSADH